MLMLVDCIAGVESDHNQFAFRFEPVLFQSDPQWVANQEPIIQKYNGCSQGTAEAVACTSYGKYQLLGANIYSLGYQKNIFAFVNNASGEQEIFFGKFILTHHFNSNEDVAMWKDERFTEFATFYNGPGDVPDYVASMKRQLF